MLPHAARAKRTDSYSPDTAFVASKGQWLLCDDSRVTPADERDVVVCTKLSPGHKYNADAVRSIAGASCIHTVL